MTTAIPEQMKKRLDSPGCKAFYCPFCRRLTISPANLIVETALCALCAGMERHRVLNFVYDRYITPRDGGGGTYPPYRPGKMPLRQTFFSERQRISRNGS